MTTQPPSLLLSASSPEYTETRTIDQENLSSSSPSSSPSTGRKITKCLSEPYRKSSRIITRTQNAKALRDFSIKKDSKTTLEQELEAIFKENSTSLLQQLHTLIKQYMITNIQELQDIIKNHLETQLKNSSDANSWLRTSDQGTHLWTVYISLVLSEIFAPTNSFEPTKLKKLVHASKQHGPIFFWESLTELLSNYPTQLTLLANVNQYACKILQEKTPNAVPIFLHALTLQCLIPQILEKDLHGNYKQEGIQEDIEFSKTLLTLFNDDNKTFLQGLEAIFISGTTDVTAYSLRQAIAKYDGSPLASEQIYKLVYSLPSNNLCFYLEAAWPALQSLEISSTTTLITTLMASAKDSTPGFLIETPGTLLWRLLMQKTLCTVISPKDLGTLSESLFNTHAITFWKIVVAKLKDNQPSLVPIQSLNRQLKPIIDQKSFPQALLFGYFIPQILSYVKTVYASDQTRNSQFTYFFCKLRDSLNAPEQPLQSQLHILTDLLT